MLEKEQQQKEEQQKRAIAEAAPIAVVQKAPEYSLSDMEAYIRKMTEYVNHMQMLEKRNQLLESENSRIQEENNHLRREMAVHIKPGIIAAQIQKSFPSYQ